MASQDPTIRSIPKHREIIPNQYVVVFKRDTTHEIRATHRAWAAEKHFSALSVMGHHQGTVGLRSSFNLCGGKLTGYCASFDKEMAKEVDAAEEVDFVEPDYKVYATKVVKQTDSPSWGLARLSNVDKLTDENKTVYTYDDEAAGIGKYAYIIDTGIIPEHEDFESRATFGYNSVPGSTNTDKHGHGTHVAGTIGSKTFGVSKKVSLIGVKVLGDDGSGSNSSVIHGIQWALKDAQEKGVQNCVANMSLGGGESRALNSAVRAAVNSGLTIVVAAGNEGEDASTTSPASEPTAITVGATDVNDEAPWWSNWGKRVDINAPGDLITSTWIDESGGGAVNRIKSISGTSMASPHVAGLVAYLISKYPELDKPAKIVAKLKELASKDKIGSTLHQGTINAIAFNGVSECSG